MNFKKSNSDGAKVIPLRRGADQRDLHLARRNQVVSRQIVGILSELLLSWRMPQPKRG